MVVWMLMCRCFFEPTHEAPVSRMSLIPAAASREGVTAHGGPYRSFAVCPIRKPSPAAGMYYSSLKFLVPLVPGP